MLDNTLNLNELFNDDPEMQRLFGDITTPNFSTIKPPDLNPAQNNASAVTPFDFNAFFQKETQNLTEPIQSYMGQELATPQSPGQQIYSPKPLDEFTFGKLEDSVETEFQMLSPITEQLKEESHTKNKLKKQAKQTHPEKPDTPIKKVTRVITNLLFWTLCISLVGGSILFATSNDPTKNYFGFRTYNVLTASMTPQADSPPGGFHAGDVIIVKMVTDPKIIKVGDIITFNPGTKEGEETAYLTHRVIEVKTELPDGRQGLYFVTQGDANPSPDPAISAEMLIGKKVASIPYVGGFLQNMRQNFVLAIVMIISLFGCVFLFRWYFSKPPVPLSQNKNRLESLA